MKEEIWNELYLYLIRIEIGVFKNFKECARSPCNGNHFSSISREISIEHPSVGLASLAQLLSYCAIFSLWGCNFQAFCLWFEGKRGVCVPSVSVNQVT